MSYSIRPIFWLLALLPGGLAALLAWQDPFVGSDGLRYLMPIHHWLAGEGWSFLNQPEVLYPPGYGATSWLFYLLYPDIEFSGIAVSVVSYGLLGLFLYSWLKPLLGTMGALLVAALFYGQATLLSFATTTMTECLYILVTLILFRSLINLWQTPSFYQGILVGLLVGYGFMLRPEMIGIGSSLLALMFIRACWRSIRLSEKSHFIPSLLALTIFVLTMLGYGWMQKQLSGHFALTGKGVTSMHVMESREQGQEVARNSGHGQSLLGYFLAKDPQWVWQRWKKNFWRERHLLWNTFFPLMILAGIAWGAALVTRQRLTLPLPWQPWLWMGGCFAIPLLVYPFFMVDQRYLLSAATPLVLLLAIFIAVPKQPRLLQPLLLTAAFLMLAHTWWQESKTATGHQGLRQAGIWLANHPEIPLEQVITPRKKLILSFYALNKKQVLPDPPIQARFHKGELATLLSRYRELGYDYLVLDWKYAFDSQATATLWANPASGQPLGAELLHDEERFKVFRLLATQ
ncbi:MAG: glycosyltransferase family 39 protein [Magnetococcales bacterium]|nr:glycosyltransferase family 39 protein [Magnetococcales bacterium]NGZ25658.1 glycosyltransferase family 39 protein [Magnetococcales bacterium]